VQGCRIFGDKALKMNKSLAQNSSFTAENQTSGSTPRFTAGDTDKGIASSAFPFTLANF
jgi:hypothetical protein